MSTSRRVLRNVALSLALNVGPKAANVIAFVAIGRRIGAEAAGVFSLATTYLLIFSALAWGLDELLVRQVARDRATTNQYFGAFLSFRVVLTGLSYLIFIWIIRVVIAYPDEIATPILIMGLSLWPDSLGNVGQAVLMAHERFDISVVAAFFTSLAKLLGLGVTLWFGFGLTTVSWVWLIGSSLGALCVLLGARPLYGGLHPTKWFDSRFWQEQWRVGVPFFVIGFLLTLEYQTDVVILSVVRSNTEVGWYSATTTIVFALTLVPQAYRVAIYPLMARYQQSAPDKLWRLYDNSMAYLGALAALAAISLSVLSPLIIRAIYGPAFEGAILPLKILTWSLVVLYLNVPNSRLLLVYEKQNWLSGWLVVSMGLNIILNLILDSTWGALGAAIARVCSALVFFLPNYIYIVYHVRSQPVFVFWARPLVAVVGMIFMLWLMRDSAWWISFPISALSYLGLWLAGQKALVQVPHHVVLWIRQRRSPRN